MESSIQTGKGFLHSPVKIGMAVAIAACIFWVIWSFFAPVPIVDFSALISDMVGLDLSIPSIAVSRWTDGIAILIATVIASYLDKKSDLFSFPGAILLGLVFGLGTLAMSAKFESGKDNSEIILVPLGLFVWILYAKMHEHNALLFGLAAGLALGVVLGITIGFALGLTVGLTLGATFGLATELAILIPTYCVRFLSWVYKPTATD